MLAIQNVVHQELIPKNQQRKIETKRQKMSHNSSSRDNSGYQVYFNKKL